jgi:16S rRNA (cytosine967-C5)-methyltransferase
MGHLTSSDPRRRAVEVLTRVEVDRAHAARLLTDAAPATREIVLGTLRWQSVLDHLLSPHLKRALTALDPVVRAAARAGLYEARRMGTPAGIAVSEAVEVTKALAPRAAGLVNAVLRRAADAPWPDPADERVPLWLRFSHPEWLVDRWLARLGDEPTRRLLAANQEPAPLTLLAAASAVDEIAAAGTRLEPHPLVAGVVVCRDSSAAAIAALRAGRAYAMDANAAVVARLLPATPGRTVELAAAPGGKSLVLATERETRHLAVDRHLGRVLLMRANVAAAARPPLLAVADGESMPLAPASCDAVLLDGPCSGTGTLRRHPEIRWRLRPADLAALAAVQRRLARAAAALLRPGGRLLYATCSLEPEENAGVIEGLGLEPWPLADRVPAGVAQVHLAGGGVVILPDAWGDGFTVHMLQRRS